MLTWVRDVDADEYLCDENADGVCTLLRCSKCGALVTYEPCENDD